MTNRLLKILALLLCCAPMSGSAASHVRVILDTSGSMKSNDSPRLAILSALLLYDLTHMNLSMDDSFAVLPFDLGMRSWTSGPPPVVGSRWIRAAHNKRSEFVNAIRSIEYKAPNTYYFPYLLAALTDLQQAGSRDDQRVIILVTDGVPEDPDREIIRRELLPQVQRENIKLYVLALGPQATPHQDAIREVLGGSSSAGQLLVDPDGTMLPQKMIEIFSRSFGYTAESGTMNAPSVTVDLEGRQTPDRVAVVLFWRNAREPELRLRSVPDGDVNAPDGIRTGMVVGGSYATTWVLAPTPGPHRVNSLSIGASLVVLRPATLMIEVQPMTAGAQTYSAISKTPLHLRVLVRPIGGTLGDPGPVQLSFQTHGPRQGTGFAWDGERLAPQGAGTGTSDGRYFYIAPVFLRGPTPPQSFYDGYLTIEVRRNESVIGALSGSQAYHLTVYPYLQLQPEPPSDYAKVNGQQRSLSRHELGCTSFKFHIEGNLPHPERPSYSFRAFVESAAASDIPVLGAEYTLDDEAITSDSTPRHRHSDWITGHVLSGNELQNGKHELCVLLEDPHLADVSQTVNLNVRFILLEAPYDGSQIVDPFNLKVLIVPANWFERYSAWLALALGTLLLLLQVWYQRFRPEIPSNLRLMIGNPPVLTTLGEGSLHQRWLGLIVNRQLLADDGNRRLGWLRPVTKELYALRPERKVQVEPAEYSGREIIMAVNRYYHVKTESEEYDLRLQYI